MLNMVFLGVRIDEDIEKAIKATGRPRSEVVRDALRMYLELEPRHMDYVHLIRDIERLLDEKLEIAIKDGLNVVKQAPLNTVKQAEEDQLKHVLQVLLDLLDKNIEPTSTDLAERAGMNARPMGTLLSKHGIKSKSLRRSGKSARFYTLDLREMIEALL